MGLRETINQNPVVTSAVVGVLTLVALFMVGRQACGGGGGDLDQGQKKAFFTVDEGKTKFAEDVKKIPPFDKDGKEAYRVVMFKCPDGKEIVGFLERYPKEQHAALEQAGGPSGTMIGAMAREVKKPGDKVWVSMQKDPQKFGQVSATPKCADGSSATPLDPQ